MESIPATDEVSFNATFQIYRGIGVKGSWQSCFFWIKYGEKIVLGSLRLEILHLFLY